MIKITVKLFIKILGAIIVAASIFLASFLDKPGEYFYSTIFSIIAATLFLFIDPLIEFYENRKVQKARRKNIKNHIRDFNEFLKNYTSYKAIPKDLVREIDDTNIDHQKKEKVYDWLIRNKLDKASKVEKDGIFCALLCYEIDREENLLRVDSYKKIIAGIFEKYDFLNISDESKLITQYYYNYKMGEKLNAKSDSLDYAKQIDAMTNKYDKTYNLSLKLKFEKDQIEEFRKTLAILISRGKLNIDQIEKRIREKLSKQIHNKSGKAFLIFANNYQRIPAIKNLLDSYPGVVYSYKKPHFLPESIQYLHTRIIYPPEDSQNPQRFIENKIKPLIPEDRDGNGFISILPIEGTEIYSYPTKVDNIESENVREGFETITAYKTGMSFNLVEFYIDNLQEEIKVDELLSVIPFNVFVPNIGKKPKNLIIDHYDRLKKEFGIDTLSDWGDVNGKDLKHALVDIDKGRNSDRIFEDDRWDEIATKIITSSKKHQSAIESSFK